MGYSISVAVPDRKTRDRLFDFFKTLDWMALREASGPEGTNLRTVVEGRLLAYPPKGVNLDQVLGFNGSMIPHAAWAVVAWVATQFRAPGQDPVIYYDDEALPCTVADDPTHSSRHFLVDNQGVFVIREENRPLLLRVLQGLAKDSKHDLEQGKLREQAWIRNMNDAWRAFNAQAGAGARDEAG